MKHLVFTAAAVAALVGTARADSPRDDNTDAQNLTAKELRKYFAPYVPAIRDCYVTRARSGDGWLRLELVVHPDGSIAKFGFTAPHVEGQALRGLDACLRPLSGTWHFPVRRDFTTAIMPFYFMRSGPAR